MFYTLEGKYDEECGSDRNGQEGKKDETIDEEREESIDAMWTMAQSTYKNWRERGTSRKRQWGKKRRKRAQRKIQRKRAVGATRRQVGWGEESEISEFLRGTLRESTSEPQVGEDS